MTFAITYSRACVGVHAPVVSVEAHISNGIPRFNIVGLPETAVKESKDRVRGALLTSQFDFPARRITVNLAPADLPKEGGRFDLPIAVGILAATRQIPSNELAQYEFAGELALSGELRPIQRILPFALQTSRSGRILIVPRGNADEALLAGEMTVLPADHLLEICAHLTHKKLLTAHSRQLPIVINNCNSDLQDVHGQQQARRALEISAAGGHSLLMVGPPGTGKTMLASRLPSILPELNDTEALEVAALDSISSGSFNIAQWRKKPFRSPHHTASTVAMVGGGNPPRPGEISLAHRGVLFLDELPEFNRPVLEALREPLESGIITISRAARQAEFPAHFQLIAAMNPCPCGYLGDANLHRCQCTPTQIKRYKNKISGPLLDRIDMQIAVTHLPRGVLTTSSSSKQINEDSATVRTRVLAAREIQVQRCQKLNAELRGKELEHFCQLKMADQTFLEDAITKLQLSARAYHRTLRVARTIADLVKCDDIQHEQITEALAYRRFEL